MEREEVEDAILKQQFADLPTFRNDRVFSSPFAAAVALKRHSYKPPFQVAPQTNAKRYPFALLVTSLAQLQHKQHAICLCLFVYVYENNSS